MNLEKHRIEKAVGELLEGKATDNQKIPVSNLGFISCASSIYIKHVPFYEPCVILVLSGRKLLFEEMHLVAREEGRKIEDSSPLVCEAGELIVVPAPSNFGLRNEPDPHTGKYFALLIPFAPDLLVKLARSHSLLHKIRRKRIGVLKYRVDESVEESVLHYLRTLDDPKLLNHRLMEILLTLVTRDPDLLAFTLQHDTWSQRVRTIISEDLAHPWMIGEVCKRLNTTESTLRRNLRQEDASFRDVLYESRLTAALMQLLQTGLPVTSIAYDCGYRSVSRFSSNFRKRFGVAPTEFRNNVNVSEQTMTA